MEKNKQPKGLPTQALNKKRETETHGGKSLTERVGYTDFAKRMAQVELAGENLRQYRASDQLFDAIGETDIDKIDWQQVRVRSLGFGLAEYSEHLKAIAKRKAELYERIGHAKKAKAIKDALAAREKSTAAEAAETTPPSAGEGVQGAAHAPANGK